MRGRALSGRLPSFPYIPGVRRIVGERAGVGTASTGAVVLTVLSIGKLAYGITLGDASCADGGGKKLAQVSRRPRLGVRATVVPELITVVFVKSYWVTQSGGPTTCVDGTPYQRSAP